MPHLPTITICKGCGKPAVYDGYCSRCLCYSDGVAVMKLLETIYWNFASSVARSIYSLLVVHPEDWKSTDGYYLNNEAYSISIWIANEAYGLHFTVCRRDLRSGFWDRRLIWSAIRKFNIPDPEQFKVERASRELNSLLEKAAAK